MNRARALSRQATLGDLIAASFDLVEKTGAHPSFRSELVACDLQVRLARADRLDLIRALAQAERQQFGGATAHREARAAIAAAG
jgi:hypothetical protein